MIRGFSIYFITIHAVSLFLKKVVISFKLSNIVIPLPLDNPLKELKNNKKVLT